GNSNSPHAGCRERRQCVRNDMASWQRHLQTNMAFRANVIKRRAERTAVFYVLRCKECGPLDSIRQNTARRESSKRRNAWVPCLQYRGGIFAIQTFDQLTLCERDFIQGRKKFQMRR